MPVQQVPTLLSQANSSKLAKPGAEVITALETALEVAQSECTALRIENAELRARIETANTAPDVASQGVIVGKPDTSEQVDYSWVLSNVVRSIVMLAMILSALLQ